MKKNIALSILFVFLVVMNSVLLFLVLNKPDKKHKPPKDFITSELNFKGGQLSEFKDLEKQHHNKMQSIDAKFHNLKQDLFANIQTADFSNAKRDSITTLLGELSVLRETEIFSYFKQIDGLCNAKQKNKLKSILSDALKKGPGKVGGPPPPPRP